MQYAKMVCPKWIARAGCSSRIGWTYPPYVIHGLCNFPGLLDLLRTLDHGRAEPPARGMGGVSTGPIASHRPAVADIVLYLMIFTKVVNIG
jgi:hypothetical protein